MPTIGWIDALRLYNVGMNSWTIPKKGSGQFDAIEKVRRGEHNVKVPEDTVEKLTSVNPAKFKIDVEAVRSALRTAWGQRKKLRATPSTTWGEGYMDTALSGKLSVSLPSIPSRQGKFGRWWISGRSDGKEVVFEVSEDDVRRLAFQGSATDLARHVDGALSGDLTFRVYYV
jgi:hypothetical protein